MHISAGQLKIGFRIRRNRQKSLLLAYYEEGNALEPINSDYLFSELVNPVFTADGDNVKVKVSVKFIDNQTKATHVSQYELTLHKGENWKIVK